MNLDVFLLHNAGLPGHNRNGINHLRATLHVYANKMKNQMVPTWTRKLETFFL